MSNRERPYTQNQSPIFENVVFGNFGDQPGRHSAEHVQSFLHDAGDSPAYDAARSAMQEIDLEGNLNAFFAARSAFGAAVRKRDESGLSDSSTGAHAPTNIVDFPLHRLDTPPDDAS